MNKVLLILSVFFFKVGYSATIYVDNTLPNDCASGNYSVENRNCNGSDGDAYIKVQDAINNMDVGDTIYLRGGRYHEDNGNENVMIEIPTSKNGDSWQEGHYNTLSSYPGEWAVIDGERSSVGVVLGHPTYDLDGAISYWKFSRIEITGGINAGFWGYGGPFHFRYCYIHDNYDNNGGANPGGIKGHVWNNTLVEYCYFKHNGLNEGTNHNCAHINIYSDYVENPENVDINRSIHQNIFRYNIFDTAPVGIKYKNSQWLSLSHTATDIRFKNYGDLVHHNIFLNHSNLSVDARQDFIQLYNNIFDNGDVSIGEYYSSDREPFYSCVYNCLFYHARLHLCHDHDNGDGSSYEAVSMHPYCYLYNNIFSDIGPENDGLNDLNILFTWSGWTIEDIDMNTIYVEDNLFYPRNTEEEVIDIGDDKSDFSVTQYIGNNYSTVLYATDANGLYAEQYITNASFVLRDATTIANGGIGGSHPYLEGVTFPSYIGATNPDDHDWVRGVLEDVTNVDWLKNQTGTPNWVEGYGDVNQDGQVNIDDVQLVVNVILGNTTNGRADVNGDGEANISDAQEVVNKILG